MIIDSIELKSSLPESDQYPFNLEIIKSFKKLKLSAAVTFLVGENGSGKSTFLESLAAASSLPTIGEYELEEDPSLIPAKSLGKYFKIRWKHRTQKGFFMRAEDFFGFSKRMKKLSDELEETALGYEATHVGDALNRAQGTLRGQRSQITNRYGDDLDNNSHGEGFFKVFQSRLVSKGLYLLDEPETPLSPKKILSFLCIIDEMVSNGSQFIISTHSPMLMAYPNAEILNFDESPIAKTDYQSLEHVTLTKGFLECPERYFNYLFDRD